MRDRFEKRASNEAANFDSALNVMFLAAFPLLLWVFQGSFAGVATALVEIWIFSIALRLISRGQKIQREYDAAQVAHRPRLPRKLLGSALIGVMVLILAGHQFADLLFPLVLGVFAMGLSVAAFGLDPMTDKGLNDPEVVARIEIDTAMEAIEAKLAIVADQVASLQDADLTRRTEVARDMVVRLARDNVSDIKGFRRVRKPVEKFSAMLSEEAERLIASWDGEDYLFARKRYVAKLDVMTDSFATRARKNGFQAGRDAFEMEADMLLDRMPRESAA
ncbi:hypothetical protein [Tropicibacter naphthalenivorans]|uniref:5-bromo-4-chloroindolyl phosphate hydrolysis protein n=1 Tax=Tropicibacter naphthalenivorans TaxID=441103 RepID=A0A0P1GB84_9RHOB|nr:hypothetical protein [Tropicibacter naphthalenivorans]CUH78763.1 hypothetical protein TRN7648_02150 [Tropicibacter naphthalenivorans]SMC81439.1 hypothetical protein SAMN04488093_104312 [Tropicibacter naphthalenivorans]